MLFGGFFMSKAKEKKEVTTNQGKKHLFGSSEKSDFILNMSAESAQKLCGVYSIIAVLVLCVITIPYYFTQNIKYGMDESVNRTLYLNEKFIFFISAAVLAVGFVGFIIFLIANMKKQVELKDNKSLIVPLAVVLLSVISCLLSADIFTSTDLDGYSPCLILRKFARRGPSGFMKKWCRDLDTPTYNYIL